MSTHDKKDWNKFKEKNELPDENGVEESPEQGESISDDHTLDHPSYEALEEKLTLSEQKAHENWEKSVRAMAELDNVRRRAEREVANAHRYGLEKLITSLLPVVDSMEQAIALAVTHSDIAMQEGLDLTMRLFLDVLQKVDVTQIDPMGQTFDPQQHEAMSIQEVPGTPANQILTVFQKGYRLNDRVIRPARVIVSKNSSDNNEV